jgi:lipocalin-like protein
MRIFLIGIFATAMLIAGLGAFRFEVAAGEDVVVGAWRLVSYRRENPTSGEVVAKEFEDGSAGSLIYTASGRMSVLLKATNFVAYAGTYTFEGDKIIHRVEVSNIPDFVGFDLERSVSLKGDRLTLKAESMFSDERYTLVWERTR